MTTSIEYRIQGRKIAREVIEEYCHGENPDWVEGFLRECKRSAADKLRDPPAAFVMSDSEARAFEREVIRFGKHMGSRYDQVPIEYLAWLGDQCRRLIAYLASDHATERIDSDDSRSTRQTAKRRHDGPQCVSAKKIAELFQFVGRKHMEGSTTCEVKLPAGVKLTLHKCGDRYELHTQPSEPSKSSEASK